MIYVNDKLQAKMRPDLMLTQLEMLWLEVCPFNSKRSLLTSSSTTDVDARKHRNSLFVEQGNGSFRRV
ncbi:hypothetical protein P5673_009874 [Acropora cervicornis]|uniref:Uncharacterized protein n=1 Tax=Acropora cervicornis TaxID=6130 RepID=A0AAD9V9M5_ACRCE|nr:hypothetical protein P5673_009874 [Acropora cervicornis]